VNDVADELKDLPHSMKGVLADPIKGFGVLSDYARRRASLAARLPREKGKFTLLAGPSARRPRSSRSRPATSRSPPTGRSGTTGGRSSRRSSPAAPSPTR
jgi:hypothetical protein